MTRADPKRSQALTDTLDAASLARSLRALFEAAASPEVFFQGLNAFATELRHAGRLPLRSLLRTLARSAVAEAYLETLHEVRSLLSGVASSVDVGAEIMRELFAGPPARTQRADEIAALLDCIEDAQVAAERAVAVATGALGVRDAEPASLRRCVDMAGRITRRMRRDAAPRIAGELPAVLLGPAAGEVLQVLLNLLRNAQDAVINHPEPAVTISAWVAQGTAFVCVEDNGPGFADELAPHQSTKPGGSGVGLLISRAIVESWGCALEIESRPGVGPRVVFGVPVAQE